MNIKNKITKILVPFFLFGILILPGSSQALSSEKQITSFDLPLLDPPVIGVVQGNKIILTVPNGTNVTALVPNIHISDKATISPKNGIAQDFTDPVIYIVTAEDGSTADYTATVFVLNNIPLLPSLKITDPGPTYITLEAKNLEAGKSVIFKIINKDSTTKTFSSEQTVAANSAGTAAYQFGGMVPGGHYTGTVRYSDDPLILGTVYFYTYENIGGGANNGSGGNSGAPTDLSTSGGGLTAPCPAGGCGFTDLFVLIDKVVHFILFHMALPIAAIMFAYAGFLLVTSGGETSERSKAKSIFTNVALGLVFAVAAWLIVHTVLQIVGYDSSWETWFGF